VSCRWSPGRWLGIGAWSRPYRWAALGCPSLAARRRSRAMRCGVNRVLVLPEPAQQCLEPGLWIDHGLAPSFSRLRRLTLFKDWGIITGCSPTVKSWRLPFQGQVKVRKTRPATSTCRADPPCLPQIRAGTGARPYGNHDFDMALAAIPRWQALPLCCRRHLRSPTRSARRIWPRTASTARRLSPLRSPKMARRGRRCEGLLLSLAGPTLGPRTQRKLGSAALPCPDRSSIL